jgi:hypothetical protein
MMSSITAATLPRLVGSCAAATMSPSGSAEATLEGEKARLVEGHHLTSPACSSVATAAMSAGKAVTSVTEGFVIGESPCRPNRCCAPTCCARRILPHRAFPQGRH